MTAKRKYWFSIGGVFVLAILLYAMGIRRTLQLRSQNASDGIIMQKINQSDQLIRKYTNGIERYRDNTSNDPIAEDVFSQLEYICQLYSCEILEFLPLNEKLLENGVLESTSIKLKGDYVGLVQCLNQIESSPSIGKVLNSQIKMVENLRTRKSHLQLNILIQKVVL